MEERLGAYLGLRDIEPDEGGADEDHHAEEDEGAVFQVFDHIGCHLANDEVVHPIG